jgi:hypothetical protein
MAFAARGPQLTTLDHTEIEFRTACELDLPITLLAGDGLWGVKNPIDLILVATALYSRTRKGSEAPLNAPAVRRETIL